MKSLWSPDLELAIPRPPSPISCLKDRRLFVTIVVKHWTGGVWQMRALPTACGEQALDYNTLPDVLYVFERKT